MDGLEDGRLTARIGSQAPEVDGVTYINSDNESLIGKIVKLTITDCDIYDLYAKLDG